MPIAQSSKTSLSKWQARFAKFSELASTLSVVGSDACSAPGSWVGNVALKSVAFSGGTQVNIDGYAQKYATPEWTNCWNNPYLYQVGSFPTVAAAWDVDPDSYDPRTPPMIQSDPSSLVGGLFTIPPTEMDVSGDRTQISLPATAMSGRFEFPCVQYFSKAEFVINWQVSWDGGVSWNGAGASTHPIFVTLGMPSGANPPYHSVLYAACKVGGADGSSEAETFENVWTNFRGLNVCKYNLDNGNFDIPLYYYQPGTSFVQNPGGDFAEMLRAGTGRCGMWQTFFCRALLMNAVVATEVNVYRIGDRNVNKFFVNNWIKNDDLDLYWPPYNVLPAPTEMQDPGRFPVYGSLTSDTGLAGQNDDTPSQKIWADHAIVRYGDLWYDPSYGGKSTPEGGSYSGEMDFQDKALFCIGSINYSISNPPIHLDYPFPSRDLYIYFDPSP